VTEANSQPFSIPVSPFARKLGIACDRVERDRAVYAMAFRDDNVTLADVVHGGAIASLADVAATAAAWTTVDEPMRFRGVTIDLSLSFVSAARGHGLVADARVVKRGSSVCFVHVDVRALREDVRASREDVRASREDVRALCDATHSTSGGDLVARCKAVYKLSRVETPAEKLNALFAGRTRREQMQALAALEHAGAGLYGALAEGALDEALRHALLDAAAREVANATMLEAALNRCRES
jgi:uncharacterized protein (TIGR00369 family)